MRGLHVICYLFYQDKNMIVRLLLTLSLILLPSLAYSTPDAGCMASDCHDDMGKKEFVHGPVGAGICTICHNPVEGKDHEFKFMAEKEKLCFACHDESRNLIIAENVHTPVAEGKCTQCHDPHESDYKYTLLGQASELCYQCHDRAKFTTGEVHGPVAGGDCNVCHNPHSSENSHQLELPVQNLCVSCHMEKSDLFEMRHIHPPVKEACVNCHDPHAAPKKKMLVNDTPELCYGCHDRNNYEHTVGHEPVANGSCDECHDPHASDNPKMFPVAAGSLCFSCHDDLQSYVDTCAYKHGPVQQGDCNACHNPHGSENYRILRKFFPEDFYMPFKAEHYAACFECHNQNVVFEPKTKTLTDFRDGDRNLHYLHVNKDVKGRSCKACHQAHATSQPKHIRLSVPYGSMNWELPVTFTKYDDGGKCTVGCHAPKEYHR